MRSRNIKPSFFINEELSEISFHGRILFIGLWCLADRRGVLKNRHRRIKVEIFPYDDVDVSFELSELAKHGLVCLYDDGQGTDLIQVTNFQKHQKPHPKEGDNGFPECGAVKINGEPCKKTASPASYCSLLTVPCSLNEEGRDVPAPPRKYKFASALLRKHHKQVPEKMTETEADKIIDTLKDQKVSTGARPPKEFPPDPPMTVEEREAAAKALEAANG